jgi:hypothetical protein
VAQKVRGKVVMSLKDIRKEFDRVIEFLKPVEELAQLSMVGELAKLNGEVERM